MDLDLIFKSNSKHFQTGIGAALSDLEFEKALRRFKSTRAVKSDNGKHETLDCLYLRELYTDEIKYMSCHKCTTLVASI